jgi:hypothetical protein
MNWLGLFKIAVMVEGNAQDNSKARHMRLYAIRPRPIATQPLSMKCNFEQPAAQPATRGHDASMARPAADLFN